MVTPARWRTTTSWWARWSTARPLNAKKSPRPTRSRWGSSGCASTSTGPMPRPRRFRCDHQAGQFRHRRGRSLRRLQQLQCRPARRVFRHQPPQRRSRPRDLRRPYPRPPRRQERPFPARPCQFRNKFLPPCHPRQSRSQWPHCRHHRRHHRRHRRHRRPPHHAQRRWCQRRPAVRLLPAPLPRRPPRRPLLPCHRPNPSLRSASLDRPQCLRPQRLAPRQRVEPPRNQSSRALSRHALRSCRQVGGSPSPQSSQDAHVRRRSVFPIWTTTMTMRSSSPAFPSSKTCVRPALHRTRIAPSRSSDSDMAAS